MGDELPSLCRGADVSLPAPYFQDDAVTIYWGDCREIMPHLPPVDLVLTDPPYGVGLDYASHDDGRDGYEQFIKTTFALMQAATGLVFVTTGIRNLWLYPPADWVMAWSKPNSMRRNDTGGFNMWEPILMWGKRRMWQDFFELPMVPRNDVGDHPCPKPPA